MSTSHIPSVGQLERAIALAKQIQDLKTELVSILGGSSTAPAASAAQAPGRPGKRGRRKLSPEAREKLAAAVRARWAREKSGKPAAPATAGKPAKRKRRRKISAEARARMAEAAKKRWAKQKQG